MDLSNNPHLAGLFGLYCGGSTGRVSIAVNRLDCAACKTYDLLTYKAIAFRYFLFAAIPLLRFVTSLIGELACLRQYCLKPTFRWNKTSKTYKLISLKNGRTLYGLPAEMSTELNSDWSQSPATFFPDPALSFLYKSGFGAGSIFKILS